MQLGAVLCDIPIFRNILSKVAKNGTDLARDLGQMFLDNQIDRLNKEYLTGSGISLKNNEIRDIIKVAKSLENREIFLKGTATKIISQEEGFISFLRPLMTACLPLMKNVLTTVAKSVLISFNVIRNISC